MLVVIVLVVLRKPSPPALVTPTLPEPAVVQPNVSSAPKQAVPVASPPAAPAASKLNVVARANAGPIAWSAAPDAGPASKQIVTAPIALPIKHSREVRQIAFASPDVGQAVLLSGTKLRELRLDRFDLSTGATLGGFGKLFDGDEGVFAPIVGAVSPDGGRFVHRHPKDEGKLLAWDLKDGKQIASWSPYSDSK